MEVAVPRPLHHLFTYRVPAHFGPEALVPGTWVKVPFGKSVTHAFVVKEASVQAGALGTGGGADSYALKELLEWDAAGLKMAPDVFELCRFAHEYYQAPLGEVLAAAAPPAAFSVSAHESAQLALVAASNPNPKKKKKAKALPESTEGVPPRAPRPLSDAQLQIAQGIANLPSRPGDAAIAVIEGVTGSGKTEVYLELARRALAQGKGVLVLVPEIALSSQLLSRFEEGLSGQTIGLWHSALPDGKRRTLLEALTRGETRVVIGARSAIFAPVRDLGLIVVDEEHDATYKQEERVRYHARDLAVVRARLTGARCVLGSATPSLESRERVREGKYKHFELTERFGTARLPTLRIVPLGEKEPVADLQAVLAVETLDKLRETLARGEQAMVYLNRRGFAAFLVCADCGEVAECPNCSISLTVHRSARHLRCHVCAHAEAIPDMCPHCQSDRLEPVGAGTESLEEELPRLLPEARILRLDRDQITSQTRLEKALSSFRSGEFNLLVGTQMLVKGHDFPGVTLVVVMLADTLFRWPDFRAPERALQTLLQVSGRAGRGERPGEVWIQTYDPDHPVLQVLQGLRTAREFLEDERALRQELHYPPFGRLARLRFEAPSATEARGLAEIALAQLQGLMAESAGALEILGPSEAFLEKARNAFRWDLLLRARHVHWIQRGAWTIRTLAEKNKFRLWVDVDPYGL